MSGAVRLESQHFPIEMLGGAQYVYDIKSTGGRLCLGYGKSMKKMLLLCKEAISEQYQEENNFRIAIKNFTRTYVRAIMEEENDRIHEIAVLTSKDELDDKQMSPVEEFILQSTTYLVLRRCGIDTLMRTVCNNKLPGRGDTIQNRYPHIGYCREDVAEICRDCRRDPGR